MVFESAKITANTLKPIGRRVFLKIKFERFFCRKCRQYKKASIPKNRSPFD
jgi:hypothetical protein